MSDVNDLCAIEWHDGRLERIDVSHAGVAFQFGKSSVYRRRTAEVYAIEVCGSELRMMARRLEVVGALEAASAVSDLVIGDGDVEWQLPALLGGVGPGVARLTLTNGTEIICQFDSASLTLMGPFKFPRSMGGPSRFRVSR